MALSLIRTFGASLAAGALLLAGGTAAMAADPYDVNATTSVSIFEGPGSDVVGGQLVCVPGKASYNIGVQGVLDMNEVKTQWAQLRDMGVEQGFQRSRGNFLAAMLFPTRESIKTSLFDPLVVSSTFTISFVIADPSGVTVDTSMADTAAELQAFYQADNQAANPLFAEAMVPVSGFSYDPATGRVQASYALRDGLTAAELDAAYEAMSAPLTIKTPAGMITVTADQHHAAAGPDGTAVSTIQVTDAHVVGEFSVTSVDPLFGGIVNGVLDRFFPMTFGQPGAAAATTVVTVAPTTRAAQLLSFESASGEPLPAEVLALEPADSAGLTDAEASAVPAQSFADVAVEGGTWSFTQWRQGALARNDDAAVSSECRVAAHVGVWTFTAAPAPTPTADPAATTVTEPTKPTTKRSSRLAVTGTDLPILVAAASGLMLLGGLAVARRARS